MSEPRAYAEGENEAEAISGQTPAVAAVSPAAAQSATPPNTASTFVSTPAVFPVASAARIDSDLLAVESLDIVTQRLAQQCSEVCSDRETLIIVGGRDIHKDLARARLVAMRLEAIASLLETIGEAGEEAGGGRSLEGFSTALIGSVFTAATNLLGQVDGIAKLLAVAEEQTATDLGPPEELPSTLVAGQLRRLGHKVRLADATVIGQGGPIPSVVARIEKAAKTALARADAEQRTEASEALRRLDNLLHDSTSTPTWINLLLPLQKAAVLSVAVVKAGGIHKRRTSLLTALGLKDPSSVQAGAAVAWSLTDVASGDLIAADVTYQLSAEMRTTSTIVARGISNVTKGGVTSSILPIARGGPNQ